MKGFSHSLIHLDQHALLLADGIVARLDGLADPVEEWFPDDRRSDVADPLLRRLEELLTVWQERQDVWKLLKEGVDELQAEGLVGWHVDLLHCVHRDV